MSNNSEHRLTISGLLEVFVLMLLVASLLSYFGNLHWYLELLSHFRHLYFGLACILIVVSLLFGSKSGGYFALFASCLNLLMIFPIYYSPENAPELKSGPQIKILLSNVYTQNREHNKLLELVQAEFPDIVVLQEVDSRWLNNLTPLFEQYPHRIAEPRNDNFGIAVFSKLPTLAQNIVYWGSVAVPSVEAQYHIDNKTFHLLATHPLPPISEANYQFRNEQLMAVTERAIQIEKAVLIVGDLNITPWSSDYRKFESQSGLINARKGIGILPTWPAQIPLLRIPIDHVLHSKDFKVEDAETLSNIGSDHLPLLVTLRLGS